jgi:outer membrane protein assembly factor BamD (BamD/ComL family)
MTGKVNGLALAALLASGCATAGGSGPGVDMKVWQADHKMPLAKDLEDDNERAEVGNAQRHVNLGNQASESGNQDQARVEWKEGADGFMHVAERFPSSEWRIVYERSAAESYLRANDFQGAARAADQFRNDKDASPLTKAFGARIAAGSLQGLAFQQVKAGQLDPVKIGRKTEVNPRPPAELWKRFVEAADAYEQVRKSDPISEADREQAASALALLAAQVEYSYDNVEDARKRFEKIFQQWPLSSASVDGVGTYLLTFDTRKDMKAYNDAVERVRAMLEANRPKAEQAAKAPDATPEQKALPEKIAGVLQQLDQEKNRLGFGTAMALLRAGKPAEAAAGFEAYVAQNPDAPDAPTALYDAAVAHAQAKEPKKAEAIRERLLEKYPDAPEAANATLAIATARLNGGDAAKAIVLYGHYLQKWPDGEQRCLALGNIGAAYERADKPLEAAARYRAYGTDAKCAKDDPNTAARALYNSGVLYLNGKKRADAKTAWTALADMHGLTDPVTKSQQDDAKQRLKALK